MDSIVVKSTDETVSLVFFVVNIVSSQSVATSKGPNDLPSLHLRGSKLKDTMMEFRDPLKYNSTVLFFPSTGSTNLTVRGNYDLRMKISLNHLCLRSLFCPYPGTQGGGIFLNNVNYAGKLYGVKNPEEVTMILKNNHFGTVHSNAKFPAIKIIVQKHAHNDAHPTLCQFQLFSPSFCINTQHQDTSSLLESGKTLLDILLRYADMDLERNRVCVERELSLGRRMRPSEIDRIDYIL